MCHAQQESTFFLSREQRPSLLGVCRGELKVGCKTIISYELSERVSSAKILIHSLDGQLIRTYPLSADTGWGYITVDAGTLLPGMYTYSLSVNNRMVVTKRMVVTE